jgi:hypothetical protein
MSAEVFYLIAMIVNADNTMHDIDQIGPFPTYEVCEAAHDDLKRMIDLKGQYDTVFVCIGSQTGKIARPR